MLEQDLARLVDGFRADVLGLLTRMINDAFECALAATDLPKTAKVATTRVPKQQLSDKAKPRQRRARRPHAAQTGAVGQTVPVLLDSHKNDESAAVTTGKPSQPGSRRSTKGPSRDEIDRLVQTGLASRLAVEHPTAPTVAS